MDIKVESKAISENNDFITRSYVIDGSKSFRIMIIKKGEWEHFPRPLAEILFELVTLYLQEAGNGLSEKGIIYLCYFAKHPLCEDSESWHIRTIYLAQKVYQWCEQPMIYELAHEMTHYIARHMLKDDSWLEEALAMTASYYFVKKMENFYRNKISPVDLSIANGLALYYERQKRKVAKRPKSISKWYLNNQTTLEGDLDSEIARQLHREFATYFLPQFYQEHSNIWRTICHLPSRCDSDAGQLSRWLQACREDNTDIHVQYIMDQLAIPNTCL